MIPYRYYVRRKPGASLLRVTVCLPESPVDSEGLGALADVVERIELADDGREGWRVNVGDVDMATKLDAGYKLVERAVVTIERDVQHSWARYNAPVYR